MMLLNTQAAFDLVNQVFQQANPSKVPVLWHDHLALNGGFAFEVDVRNYLANGGDIDRLAARSGRIEHNISTFLYGHYEVRVLNSIGLAVVIKPKVVQRVDVMSLLTTTEDGGHGAIVVGMPRWGKTTLLQHLAFAHQQAGVRVVVLDTIGSPARWPGMNRIGGGYKYNLIEAEIDTWIATLESRNDEIANGQVEECSHEPWLLIADEFPGLVDESKSLAGKVFRLIREGRKANLSVFLGSHTDDVNTLGLAGRGKFRDAFYFIYLSPESKHTREVKVTLGYKSEPMTGIVPGEFRPLLSRETVQALPASTNELITFCGGAAKPYTITVAQQQALIGLAIALNDGGFSVQKIHQLASRLATTRNLKYSYIYDLYKFYEERELIQKAPGGNQGAQVTAELKQLAGITDQIVISLKKKLAV